MGTQLRKYVYPRPWLNPIKVHIRWALLCLKSLHRVYVPVEKPYLAGLVSRLAPWLRGMPDLRALRCAELGASAEPNRRDDGELERLPAAERQRKS